MSTSLMYILKEFKSQLTAFFDELIEQFPYKGELVVMRLFIANNMIIKDTMLKFSKKINKNNNLIKTMVKNRDSDFFLKQNIFDNIGKTDSDSIFKELWTAKNVDDEDRKIIWEWVDSLFYIVDKFDKLSSVKQV